MSFDDVTKFENTIAKFYNAPYAVAVDCCTHAIELCLRFKNVKETACPKRTYLSIPLTLEKLSLNWSWIDKPWHEFYFLEHTNIIDAAVLWKENSYIPNTLTCISFQYQKHLSLGRGGMILLDDKIARNQLIRLSYDGRERGIPWADQEISTLGYHYYMTPETASLGLQKFNEVKNKPTKKIGYRDYPDLSFLPIFNK